MNTIKRQAIDPISSTAYWLYSEWSNGEITRLKIEQAETGLKVGTGELVRLPPLHLVWKEVSNVLE